MGKVKSFYRKLFFWTKIDPVGEQRIEIQSFNPSEGGDA